MRHRLTLRTLAFGVLVIFLVVSGLVAGDKAGAQGITLLRQPFAGTYRLTAYVDHRSPVPGVHDGNVVVYTGEEHPDCPDCGDPWTTQGPYCYDSHNATDYGLPENTPVLAAASGKVTLRGLRPDLAYGKSIQIDHDNGYATYYCHLADYSVNVNDQVVAGQQIGLSGNTGGDIDYHLHFEVQRDGNVVDPFGWRGTWSDPLADSTICLWGDGQCSDIVVEDESDRFARDGTGWNWDCCGNGWTMRYVANAASESASAYWYPALPFEGPYDVFVFVPPLHATTTEARYIVRDKYGNSAPWIIQNSYSDEWVDLGSYDFWDSSDNPSPGWVHLGNVTGEAAGTTYVGFDSVKFRQFRTFVPAGARHDP